MSVDITSSMLAEKALDYAKLSYLAYADMLLKNTQMLRFPHHALLRRTH